MRFLPIIGALALGAVAIAASTTTSADEPANKKGPPKWVVHSIEMSTVKRAPFRGSVGLRLEGGGSKGQTLTYYWGGKCKGTQLTVSRHDFLFRAMKERWAVEIPSFPIRRRGRIHMCMKALRIVAR